MRVSSGSTSKGAVLEAMDTIGKVGLFKLETVEIYSPARHRMNYRVSHLKNKTDSNTNNYKQFIPDVEIVFYLLKTDDPLSPTVASKISYAAISFLFKETIIDGKFNDASFFLQPFARNLDVNNNGR